MKKYSNLLKRSQALVLAVAMMLTVICPALCLNISADEKPTVNKTEGAIVAENYDLTKAEKDLLSSGLLAGATLEYTVPANDDGLVSVDIDTKTIEAKNYEDWVPTTATLVVGDDVKETVTLKNGKGVYTYDGAMFSVKVDYVYKAEVAEKTQETLLSTPAWLKQGVANLDAISAQSGNLYILEQAMPELVKFANEGVTTPLGSVEFSDECKAAVKVLNDQMKANDGKLNLSSVAEAYDAASSAVQYLLTEGAKAEKELDTLVENVAVINEALATMVDNLAIFIDKGWVSAELADQLKTLAGICENLTNNLVAVSEDSWTATKKGTALVADDLTATQYTALDAMVAALVSTTPVGEIKNPLVVDTAVVTLNMAMFDVTYKVVLNTYVDGILTTVETNPVVVTFPEGTAEFEIEGSGEATSSVNAYTVLESAWADWTAEGLCDEDHYSFNISGLPETLTEDITVTITLAPKNYTVTYDYNGSAVKAAYGSEITLEKHTTEGKVYDYYVNGTYVPEGESITVTGDLTIDRTEGKPYNQSNFYKVVTDCFFTTGTKGANILSSGALNGNEIINVRYPEGNLVTLVGATLTAQSYPASYNGLTWAPYTYTVIGSGVNTTYQFGGSNTATITEADYDRVEVNYQLVLTNFSESQISDALNLPAKLAADADAQKKALDKLATYLPQMQQLDKTKLGALNGVISVAEISDELKAEFSAVVSSIINNCLEGNQLRITTILAAYANGGLGYYYQNSEAVINEIDTLSSYLTAMLSTEEKVDALGVLVSAAGFPEYADKIADLEKAMADVKAALTAPDAAIDLKSPTLNKLVAALEATGTVETPAAGPLYMVIGDFSVNADKKATVSVVINGVTYAQFTKVKDQTLTAEEIATILAFVDAKVAELGYSDDFYTSNYDKAALKALLTGATVGELEEAIDEMTYTWTAKTFTVVVGGAEQQITVDDLTVKLPASSTSGVRYEYVIDGKTISVVYGTTYTFTAEQVIRLFVDGKYTVTLNEIDVAFETLKGMVDDLNASCGGAMEFALVEKNGAYSIVLKLDAANANALMGAAMGLVNSGYTYIGVGGNGFIYMDESNTMKISLQAVVDALMNSGFGMDTLVKAINANGSINNMKLDGKVVSDKKLSTYGGLLMESTMELGNTSSDAMVLPFYVTLGSASSQIVQIRNLVAGRVGNYVDATCEDGAAHITLNMPAKAYEAYLAVLLVTDNVDFSSVNAMNSQIAIGFVKDMIDPLMTGNVTTTTLTNTLGKFGYNLDLTGYEGLWQELCAQYSALEFTYDDADVKSGMITGNLDISALIDRMNLGELGKMIVEYNSGIDFAIKLTLDNIGTQYDALYVDVRADGVVNKAGLTTNLPAYVSKLSGGAIVILLDDVNGDLNFSKTTVLNLNGCKVDGDVTAKNSLIIVDTALDKNGEVTGNVSGSVDILGGKYATDVTKFLKEGYTQNNGVVTNDYFNIVKDEEGNVNVELNAGLLAIDAMPDVLSLVIDIATELICNGYSTNSLYLDGNMVYDIGLVDLVGIYADSNRLENIINQAVNVFDSAELGKVINAILAYATDYDAMCEAVKNDKPIMSFDMTTGAWSVALRHETDGDYLTVDLTTANTKTSKLNVVVTGNDTDKAQLADILEVMAEIVEADLSVDMKDGFSSTDNKNFVLDWSGAANVTLDLTNPDYAILVAVIVADGIGSSKNTAVVEGIRDYYENNSMAALKAAFDKLTVQDIITALENVQRGEDFKAMLNRVGLNALNTPNYDELVRIEGLFDNFIKATGAILRKLDIDRGSRTLGSFAKPDTNVYEASKSSIEKSFTASLFRGYSLTMDLAITELTLQVKMFDVAPEFKDDHGEPTIDATDKLAGWEVDTDNKYIYLDTHFNGITADELASVLNFIAYNHTAITYDIENKSGLVFNGAKLTATAINTNNNTYATVEYTIIVLGDIDANGRLTTKDPWTISEAMVGNAEPLTELQLMASDLNCNNRVDVGDTALIAQKFVDWESYFTRLKNDADSDV